MEERLKQLEDRVAHLERELKEVRLLMREKKGIPGWRQIAGIFEDSEVFDEVIEEIRKIRAADRAAAGCTTPDPFGTPAGPRKKTRTRKAE